VEVRPAPTLGSIAAALLEHVVEEARADLRSEHPASAVELYFGPIGCQALPSDSITRGSCSIDGYYTSDVDPHQPWIFYADDVHEDRARFTILIRIPRSVCLTHQLENQIAISELVSWPEAWYPWPRYRRKAAGVRRPGPQRRTAPAAC